MKRQYRFTEKQGCFCLACEKWVVTEDTHEVDDEFIDDLANDLTGMFIGFSKAFLSRRKARARYLMRKNIFIKEAVLNEIERREAEYNYEYLGGLDVQEIMDSTFPHGW